MVDVNARRRLCTLVAAAFIDGKFENAEKTVIYKKGREMGFSPQGIDEIIELGRKGALAISVPPTQKLKEDLLNDLIDVACADGRLDPSENHLLMKFAGQLGMQVHDLGERVRRRMGQARRPQPEAVVEVIEISDEPAPAPAGSFFHRHEAHKPPEPSKPPPRVELPPGPLDAPSRDAFRAMPPPGTVGGPDLEHLVDQSKDPLTARPPGPVKLDEPQMVGSLSVTSLGFITSELAMQRIILEGREGGVRYVREFCGVCDELEAARIVDEIMRAHPDIQTARARLKTR